MEKKTVGERERAKRERERERGTGSARAGMDEVGEEWKMKKEKHVFNAARRTGGPPPPSPRSPRQGIFTGARPVRIILEAARR